MILKKHRLGNSFCTHTKHFTKCFVAILSIIFLSSCDLSKYKLVKTYDLTTVFEKSKGTKTATYSQTIAFYKELDDAFSSISVEEIGTTDSGKPLHLIIYNPDNEFDFEKIREEKQVLLINNGIHPGEPDGIDATMMLMRDLAQDSIKTPKNTVVAAIAVYNVGGMLNRNSTSRVNQNGPLAYGFRGNGRNFDLNRDFMKADTRNTQAFYEIFHRVKPDVFVGTHVSNGADYQYTLTHLFTQHNKLGGKLGSYLQNSFMPKLETSLAEKKWEVTPYVNVFNQKPDNGFSQFMDSPRYSSGYTTLWNTLGLMVETHMLKPYKQRVLGTYDFLKSLVEITEKEGKNIAALRKMNVEEFAKKKVYPMNFVVDSTKIDSLNFKGYEAENEKSNVTGMSRLKYDREKPFTKKIAYYNWFKPSDSVFVPKAYIIPQAWWPVIERLKWNKIEIIPLEKDSIMLVESYRIEDFETTKTAYEGHYLHFDTKVSIHKEKVSFRKGDFIVPTDQPGFRYLIEALEPIGKDSFFNWNFFDSVLQQKEHFSPYIFEDLAYKFLQKNPEIKKQFEEKKSSDRDFEKEWYAQLNWIYRHSPYYEKAHRHYPIYRFNQ
ncbi:MAG TPA: M14 family metallopeptidase [Flavobacteriaceae bacterium]|nr:M14 family metallopeptidase [Flavobacteriaceae bacterium]